MPLEATQEAVALAWFCNGSTSFLYNLYDEKITFAYRRVDW